MSNLRIGKADRKVGAERRRGKACRRHSLDHHVCPGLANQAQSDVQRRLIRRASRMIEPPRAVKQIPRIQCELACRRTGRMLVRIESLPPQREHNPSVVQGPQLRSCDLQNEHVVAIEVRLETLRLRRRKVDVRLKMAAERPLDCAAESSKRRQAFMQLRKRDRRARTEQLVGTRQVDPTGRLGVGKRVVLGLQLPCRVDQKNVRPARGGCREVAIDRVDAQQRLEPARVAAVRSAAAFARKTPRRMSPAGPDRSAT